MNNMKPFVCIVTMLSLWTFTGSTMAAQGETFQTRKGTKVQVEVVVSGLNHPWGMAFLPDDRLLITERNTGKLYVLDSARSLSRPLKGVPEVWAHDQGGLMDVALDPEFGDNRYVYLSYAKPGKGGRATTALGRGKLTDHRIDDFQDIFIQEPYIDGSKHFGNRIEFSPDGKYLFLGLGERFQFDPAQDLSNHLGKVIRIHPDGRVPKDNPFVGRANAEDEIWSLGHRNIEAMDFRPETNTLWAGEMGPRGGDELNKIEKGANYGWPVVSWGDHYIFGRIPDPPTRPEFADAALHWTPVISPSGMVFYEGDLFPDWKSHLLIGGLTNGELVRVVFDGTKAREEDRLPLPERVRDVDTGSDGAIYVLTDEDDGKLWRITPVGKTAD